MDDRSPRRQAGFNSRSFRESDRIGSRPDRIAFWAVILAVVVLVAAAASAHASTDGKRTGGTTPECDQINFGARSLVRGDCGSDVETLNWILNSRETGPTPGFGEIFNGRTEKSVLDFQRVNKIRSSGIVDADTRDAVVATMRRDGASWYGPGFFGSETACGKMLRRTTVGVAHKVLPCGTRVTIKFKGRFLQTRVIDRGPYVKGRKWDLTAAAAKRLNFKGAGAALVRSAIVR